MLPRLAQNVAAEDKSSYESRVGSVKMTTAKKFVVYNYYLMCEYLSDFVEVMKAAQQQQTAKQKKESQPRRTTPLFMLLADLRACEQSCLWLNEQVEHSIDADRWWG